MQARQAGIGGGDLVQELAGAVGRSVVDDDELQAVRRVLERQQALDQGLDDRLLILAGDEHGHRRLPAGVDQRGGKVRRRRVEGGNREGEVAGEEGEEGDLERRARDVGQEGQAEQGAPDEDGRHEERKGPRRSGTGLGRSRRGSPCVPGEGDAGRAVARFGRRPPASS